jgi:hypothetical protein
VKTGRVPDNETMMTINIFTVATVAFLALTTIARGDTTTPCHRP